VFEAVGNIWLHLGRGLHDDHAVACFGGSSELAQDEAFGPEIVWMGRLDYTNS
jgi:hypothetical protein